MGQLHEHILDCARRKKAVTLAAVGLSLPSILPAKPKPKPALPKSKSKRPVVKLRAFKPPSKSKRTKAKGSKLSVTRSNKSKVATKLKIPVKPALPKRKRSEIKRKPPTEQIKKESPKSTRTSPKISEPTVVKTTLDVASATPLELPPLGDVSEADTEEAPVDAFQDSEITTIVVQFVEVPEASVLDETGVDPDQTQEALDISATDVEIEEMSDDAEMPQKELEAKPDIWKIKVDHPTYAFKGSPAQHHSCPYCQRGFTYLANYRKHIKGICPIRQQIDEKKKKVLAGEAPHEEEAKTQPSTPERPVPFKSHPCSVCNKIFFSYLMLLKHRMSHKLTEGNAACESDVQQC